MGVGIGVKLLSLSLSRSVCLSVFLPLCSCVAMCLCMHNYRLVPRITRAFRHHDSTVSTRPIPPLPPTLHKLNHNHFTILA